MWYLQDEAKSPTCLTRVARNQFLVLLRSVSRTQGRSQRPTRALVRPATAWAGATFLPGLCMCQFTLEHQTDNGTKGCHSKSVRRTPSPFRISLQEAPIFKTWHATNQNSLTAFHSSNQCAACTQRFSSSASATLQAGNHHSLSFNAHTLRPSVCFIRRHPSDHFSAQSMATSLCSMKMSVAKSLVLSVIVTYPELHHSHMFV